jgi:hypothetical protein
MKLALWLVKRYPHTWRSRYEPEMVARLEEHPITVLTLFDLCFGMLTARLDPHYQTDPARVGLSSPRGATGIFLAAWSVFVLFAQWSLWGIGDGMALLVTRHDMTGDYVEVEIWHCARVCSPFLPYLGAYQTMNMVVGANLWTVEPVILNIAYFAITAVIITGILRWALGTRRVGMVLVLAMCCLLLPLALELWLLHFAPFPVNFYNVQLNGFTGLLGLLTTWGELVAVVGMLTLSLLTARHAVRTHRYGLLSLAVGVLALFFLVGLYQVQGSELFWGPGHYWKWSVSAIEFLGLVATLFPFAVLGMLLLVVAGNPLNQRPWRFVPSGAGLLVALMVVSVVSYAVYTVAGHSNEWRPDAFFFPLPFWFYNSFTYSSSIRIIGAGLLIPTLVALVALRSMAGGLAASSRNVPAPQYTTE